MDRFWPNLSQDAVKRSIQLFELVQGGWALELFWAPVIATLNDGPLPRWVATFQVSTDALKLGSVENNVRPTFTDREQIKLCELLGLSRTTAKLADLAWLQSPIKLTPWTASATEAEVARMATKEAMLEHSTQIDAELIGRFPDETVAPYVLRRPVGKDWLAANLNWSLPGGQRKATNYGWHTSGPSEYRAVTLPTVRVLQPYANFHPWTHTDYSQTATFVRPLVQLRDLRTGQTDPVTLHDLNRDPVLARIWNHDGTIKEGAPHVEKLGAVTWGKYGAVAAIALGAIAASAAILSQWQKFPKYPSKRK